jgi:hypothetical protein
MYFGGVSLLQGRIFGGVSLQGKKIKKSNVFGTTIAKKIFSSTKGRHFHFG